MKQPLPLDPDAPQRKAADRNRSVWVAASAGTGKTTVLTNRVLNLLLGDAAPERLLCLTFTKAAAAEMSNRINKKLSEWAVCPHTALREDIRKLTGTLPEEETCDAARRLFARVLDTPGGMQIMTIHAFCQSVLRRFPLEAGVPPNFELMDDRSSAELMQEVMNALFAGVRDDETGELSAALSAITRRLDESRFIEIVADLIQERGRIEDLIAAAGGLEPYIRKLWRTLGFDGPQSDGSLIARYVDGVADRIADLKRVAIAMLGSSKVTDQKQGAALTSWLDSDAAQQKIGWSRYLKCFFTDKGERRRDAPTKSLLATSAWLFDVLAVEAAQLEIIRERCAAANLGEASAALMRLAYVFFQRLAREKRRRALIDYDDLILATQSLLKRPGIAPWVLFKLDGGIDHILVDEAQDTNPDQWQIVQILADEFFSGLGAHAGPRTIFAVGDAKQSIFSFQRADPQKFIEMQTYFAERARDADEGFDRVPLAVSFRSTRAVLDLVDSVFATAEVSDGVILDGVPMRHEAARAGMAGLVELWPLLTSDRDDDELPWELPTRQFLLRDPRTQLAELIAAKIKHWIDTPEMLPARGRPVRARDIMVLVRRRNAFVQELIRALKKCGVPVAGADRIVLNRQIAVMDLMALGQFLILPEDDLNLAALLKTPLFGFDDDMLLPLANGRETATLWERLQQAAARGEPQAAAAHTELAELLARADFVAPYELYADVLSARHGRRRLIGRLSNEAADAIDEFLAQTLAYEKSHIPSLQGFLHWMGSGETEVKRDPESGERDEVRIMTVHGAKGLQAPIVILPDTVSAPEKTPQLRWLDRDRVMLWVPKDGTGAELAESSKMAANRARDQEYRRLLYVALTRAEDQLYVCGWQQLRQPANDCWYNLIEEAMRDRDEHHITVPEGFQPFHRNGRVIMHAQERAAKHDPHPAEVGEHDADLPDWIDKPPPKEPSPPRPLLASRPSFAEPASRSPLAAKTDINRYQRGLVIHRLLQSLPELPREQQDAAARRFLAGRALGLEPEDQAQILAETLAVVQHPDWGALFGPASQAEVPVVGLIGERSLSGRIDRLVVTDQEVLIVDYKTNRPPPLHAADVAAAYIEQMAAYRAALEQIYPDKRVRTLLLWTDDLKLMEVMPSAAPTP